MTSSHISVLRFSFFPLIANIFGLTFFFVLFFKVVLVQLFQCSAKCKMLFFTCMYIVKKNVAFSLIFFWFFFYIIIYSSIKKISSKNIWHYLAHKPHEKKYNAIKELNAKFKKKYN
jgi:hypothetical protein